MFGVNFLVMAWPKWGGKLVGWVERFLLSCINCMSWVGLVSCVRCVEFQWCCCWWSWRGAQWRKVTKALVCHIPTLTILSTFYPEKRESQSVLWTGMVSCGGGGVEVAHAPTCNWTLQPSLHVWVFVVLIKIGGWGNVQVVDEIPPTANQLVEKWQKPAQVDKIGSGRTLHLIVNPVFTSFSA